ncbi:hybrid sensor histidine kinase/response regulator transcription factor [Flammeovirga aprica]|uniref:histidine kinase n=1 Tax=Flammeovirga aprica JL-4 TaxID=694437 RepID=A0A7X9P301_9BACT|nr:response regulator [Flammeovirga aprica]NME68618.1 response regulator [Flammeovirga aprica JL-4]
MNKFLLLITFLLSLSSPIFSQNPLEGLEEDAKYEAAKKLLEKKKYKNTVQTVHIIDSLLSEPEIEDYQEHKIDLIEIKGRTFMIGGKLDSAKIYLTEAKRLSFESDYLKGKGKSSLCLGSVESFMGHDSLAYSNLYEGFGYLEELQDSTEIALGCNHMGLYLKNVGDFDEAIRYFQRAKLIYEENGDLQGLFKVLSNEALIWKNNSIDDESLAKENYTKAISIFEEALSVAEKINNEYFIANINVNISGTYSSLNAFVKDSVIKQENLKKALLSAQKARSIFLKKNQKERLAPASTLIGIGYWKLKQFDSAEYYIEEALDVIEKYKYSYSTHAAAYEVLGLIAFERDQDYKKAEKYYLEGYAISKDRSLIQRKYKMIDHLIRLYEATGDFKNAFKYQREKLEVNNELNNKSEFRKLTQLEANFNNKKLLKEKELKDDLLKSAQKERTLWFWIVILVCVLALVVIVLYFINIRLKEAQLKVSEEQKLSAIEREKRLEELDEFKTKFFANISHEFRTPLTLMIGAIDELKEQVEKNNSLRSLEYQTKQLLELINQILDLTNLELQNNNTLKLSNTDIKELLSVGVSSFHSYAEQQNVTIDFQFETEEREGYIDKNSINKIVNNLIFNAIKFSKTEGKIVVKASIEQGILKMSFYDNGKGIAASDLPYIFDQYYHSNIGLSTTNGIGLALTQGIITKYFGKIEVESVESEWTRFDIEIPVSLAFFEDKDVELEITESELESLQSVLPEHLSSEVPEGQMSSDDKNLPSILVIDDNEDIRNYLHKILKDKYQVSLAENGQKGFEAAKELIPDIILSDVMMPEIDGIEVTRLLKETDQTSHIPVILLTAKADQSTLLKGYSTKADAYITKPFNKQELLVRIQGILENRRILQSKFREHFLVKEDVVEFSNNDEKLIKSFTAIVEDNLDNTELSVEEVAQQLFISRSQLHRKIKALTGKSSSVFMRDIRLRYSAELLKNSDAVISDIAYQTGFNTPAYFTKCFSDLYGVTPKKYREQGV